MARTILKARHSTRLEEADAGAEPTGAVSAPLMVRTKETASRSTGVSQNPLIAAAAKAKAEAAAAKANSDAAAAKAKADAEPPAAKTGRQDRSPSLRRSKRTGTAKETTGGKAPRQQRAEEKQVDSIAQRRVDASKYMDRLKQWRELSKPVARALL